MYKETHKRDQNIKTRRTSIRRGSIQQEPLLHPSYEAQVKTGIVKGKMCTFLSCQHLFDVQDVIFQFPLCLSFFALSFLSIVDV